MRLPVGLLQLLFIPALQLEGLSFRLGTLVG